MKVALDHNMRVIDVTPPTPRQLEVLDVIRRHMLKHGLPPSIREIMAHFGWCNTNAVASHVRPLVRKGLLRQVGAGKSRSYVPVVPPGCCPCCGRPLEDTP